MDEINTTFPSEFENPMKNERDDDNVPEVDLPSRVGSMFRRENHTDVFGNNDD